MSDEKVLTHPAFDRPPVVNARRHGITPRGVPMLSRERFERSYAKQKAEQEARKLTAEARLAEYEKCLDQVAYGLLQAARAIASLRDRHEGLLRRD